MFSSPILTVKIQSCKNSLVYGFELWLDIAKNKTCDQRPNED